MNQINLHSGGELVPFEALMQVVTPAATATHVPIPHHHLVQLVRSTLGMYGHEVVEEVHALDKDGLRYFGLLTLKSPYSDYSDTVGLRNSADKSFPIGVGFGSRVFICSNLAFCADVVIKRRHTTNAKRELPGMIMEIFEPLALKREAQAKQIGVYKQTALTERDADHAIMTMFRQELIGVQRIADVEQFYRTPPYDWGEPSAWRLFNAATLALTGKVMDQPALTPRLHAIIDGMCQRLN